MTSRLRPWLARHPLLRRELPWLAAELVLLVVLAYRIERWWASRPDA